MGQIAVGTMQVFEDVHGHVSCPPPPPLSLKPHKHPPPSTPRPRQPFMRLSRGLMPPFTLTLTASPTYSPQLLHMLVGAAVKLIFL